MLLLRIIRNYFGSINLINIIWINKLLLFSYDQFLDLFDYGFRTFFQPGKSEPLPTQVF